MAFNEKTDTHDKSFIEPVDITLTAVSALQSSAYIESARRSAYPAKA